VVGRDPSLQPLKRLAPRGQESASSLSHYDDATYYEKAYRARVEDVAYYCDAALSVGGPVLEYGIGNGRIALALARRGVSVVGIDNSRVMLSDLRARLRREPSAVRQRVKLHQGDMRKARLKQRFKLVIAPFNVVLHLYTRTDMEQFLMRVREHLLPAGCLLFDFSAPRVMDLALDPERWIGAPRFRHPSTQQLVRYAERFDYDAASQVLTMTLRFMPVDGSPPWETVLHHRQYFPQEMAALLHYNGFEQQRWSANFSAQPADAESDTLVVSCRPS
jgi:SAM-dependent methyltransferase